MDNTQVIVNKLLQDLGVYKTLLADLKFIGADTELPKQRIHEFFTLYSEFLGIEQAIRDLRPGEGYKEQAEQLSSQRATMLITLQALCAGVREAIDQARLDAFEKRAELMQPFKDAIIEALAGLRLFVSSMPDVKERYEKTKRAGDILHKISADFPGQVTAIGERKATPPFLSRMDRFNPGPVGEWVKLYAQQYLHLAPSAETSGQDLT